ncbi:HTH-type transcriptional repressor KstR2 [compost metagenome]
MAVEAGKTGLVSRKEAARQDKETAILDAAARVFRHKGYVGATLRDIAGEAGMLLGSLQYRYETKDALFLALAEREVDRGVQAIAEVCEATSDPLERLRGFLAGMAAQAREDDVLMALVTGSMALPPEAHGTFEALKSRFHTAFDGLTDDAVRTGALRAGIEPALLRCHLLAPLAWAVDRFCGGYTQSTAEAADTLWILALDGLRA